MKVMDFVIGYRIRCWTLLICFVGANCLHQASAQSDNFEKRSFLLPPELLSAINEIYALALQDAKRDRREMNRGPGRLFLEGRGISFPPGASAILSREQLVVANSAENLKSIAELVESYVTRVVQEPKATPTPQVLIPPFQPGTMDFETLEHQGDVYRNVTVIASTPVELEIMHHSGGATLPLAEMAPEIQTKYGYDPLKADAFVQSVHAEVPPPSALAAVFDQPVQDRPQKEPENVGLEPSNSWAAPRQSLSSPDRSDDQERSYVRILCRDGRVLRDVLITKEGRDFKCRPRGDSLTHGETLELRDAPSHLLLDFEEFGELLQRLVVVNSRTALYEFNSDGIGGGKEFWEMAKDPITGGEFVSVPEGYVLAHMNWMSLPQSALEFVLPLSGRSFSVASVGNLVGTELSKWWNKYANHRQTLPMPWHLQKTTPSKNGVLYSPFNPEMPILGNTAGEIQRLWSHPGQKGTLALAQTGNGLFFGYYREHAALEASDLTWKDVIREKSGRFSLKKIDSRRLTPSTSLIKLFDASSPKVLGADFKEFGQLKLGGEHFSAILERGIEAAVQDRIMPKGDGVSFPDAGVESAFSSALDIVVITDQVEAKLKDALPHAYIFNVESRQRVIELRKDNSQGRTKIRESRPQRRIQSEVVEIPPDLDGGLRFTDGKRVYELVPVLGGTDLIIWEAEQNKLRRF